MSASLRTTARNGMRLARFLEMGDEAATQSLAEVEADLIFKDLMLAGAVSKKIASGAFFGTRRAAGWTLADPGGDLASLLDGNSKVVESLRRIGEENFRKYFLSPERALADSELARKCGISIPEAGDIRALVQRLYIQSEFSTAEIAPPAKVFSTVGAIRIEDDRPVLAFFNRDLWGRGYSVNESILKAQLARLSRSERGRAKELVSRLRLISRRKSTLAALLDALLESQAPFFISGDPKRLRPLVQRRFARELGVDHSVISRLISNKAVELPWGTEVPLRALFPSAKEIAKVVLEQEAARHLGATDEQLRRVLRERHGIRLSRRSVAQYRKELGLKRGGSR